MIIFFNVYKVLKDYLLYILEDGRFYINYGY